MEVYNDRFLDIETLPADEQKIYEDSDLTISDGKHVVPLLDLHVFLKRNPDGTVATRNIKSLDDFKACVSRDIVYASDDTTYSNLIDKTTATVMVERFSVPDIHTSINENKTGAADDEKIPYGLKRTLKVDQANPGEGKYLYVFLEEEGMFLSKDQIYWYDGLEKKRYLDAVAEGKDLSTIQFIDEYGHNISAIYTEYEYKFGNVLARERVNLTDKEDADKIPSQTVRTYEIDVKGDVAFSDRPIEKNISEQEFVTEEVDDDKKPGKKKKVSRIKSKNYFTSSEGQFVQVIVDGKPLMVEATSLVDTDGNPIANLSEMVGQSVKVLDGENIVASTEPLTYEQANLKYDTLKTYQETTGLPDETTCLRLSDGKYVKELESVQPISFELAADDATNFDKYLIPKKVGDVVSYVVVDKNHIRKAGSLVGLDTSKAKKLVRCDFNDKNCIAIQTTSKKEVIEQCELLGEVKFADDMIANKSEISKKDLYDQFKESYKKGEYAVEDVYLDGEKIELASGSNRFSYSDVSYHDDPASNMFDYKTMKTNDISIRDGKIVGGAKFSVSNGIAESYSVWSKALLAGVTVVPLAGIFVPVLAPVVAVYSVGVLAAAPLIPIVNAGIGMVKNTHLRKIIEYPDKTKQNRKKQEKTIQKELNTLLTRDDLNQTQLEQAYASIMNEILMFAKTTSNNALVVVNGEAQVNSNNANLANKYIADYKAAKKEYDKYKKKVDALTKKGKPIPADLQEKFDKSKAELDALKNTTRGNSYEHDEKLEKLQNDAASVLVYTFVKKFPDADLVAGFSDDLKSSLDFNFKNGLTIKGLSLDASEEEITREFKNDPDKIAEWKSMRDEVLVAVEKAKERKPEQPVDAKVDEKMIAVEQLNQLVANCENLNQTINEAATEYVAYSIINNQLAKSSLLLDEIRALANIDATVSVDDINAIIQQITDKLEEVKEIGMNFNDAKREITQIDNEINEFNQIENQIVNLCGSLGYDRKTEYLVILEEYKNNITDAHNVAKTQDDISVIQEQKQVIIDNKTYAQELIEKINSLDDEAEKAKMIGEISAIYTEVGDLITSLESGEIKKSLSSFVLVLTNNKRMIKELENEAKGEETKVEEVVSLKNKAYRIAELIKISLQALLVWEKVKQYEKAETQSYVGRLIGELSDFIRVNRDATIADLQKQINKARDKYEREILPFMTEIEEKEEKAKEKEQKERERAEKKKQQARERAASGDKGADFDPRINSEDNLMDYLINRDQDLLNYLKANGVDFKDADIAEVIDRIDKKHKKGVDAIKGSKALKNPAVYKILLYGQTYITKVIAKGPVEVE